MIIIIIEFISTLENCNITITNSSSVSDNLHNLNFILNHINILQCDLLI